NGLRYGVAPALSSEWVGQQLKGTKYETAARLATALLTGGLAAVTHPPQARTVLGKYASDLSKNELEAAQQLIEYAASFDPPIKLSLADVVRQVTNNRSNLGELQRIVQESEVGRKITQDFYANNSTAIQEATRDELGRIAPTNHLPSTVGGEA